MKKPTKESLIAEIAQRHLSICTLETMGSDELDFHQIAIWDIKAALAAAFEAGKKSSETA